MRLFTLLKYSLYSVVGILVLALLGMVGLLVFIDPNDYREQMQQQAQKAGVRIELNGDISWSFYPYLGFDLNQIGLYPYDSDTQLMELGKLSLSISLLDLFAGTVSVNGIALSNTNIALSTDAQGTGNWEKIIRPSQDADLNQDAQSQAPSQASDQSGAKKQDIQTDEVPSSPVPAFISDIDLKFLDLTNINVSYINPSLINVQFQINQLNAKNFRFDSWFSFNLDTNTNIESFLGSGNAQMTTGFEARIAQDLSHIELRQFDLSTTSQQSVIGESSQTIALNLDALSFDQNGGRVDAKGIEARGDFLTDLLGKERQTIAISTDLSLETNKLKLGLHNSQINANVTVPQLGDARQKILIAGDVNFDASSMDFNVPQLKIFGEVTYPQLLTQQLIVDVNLAAVNGNITTRDFSLQQLDANLADLLQMTLKATNFTGAKNTLSTQLELMPFNPHLVLDLIKIEDKKMSSLLPNMADPETLQAIELATTITANIAEPALALSDITLVVDDTTLSGNLQTLSAFAVKGSLDIDRIDLDRYMPLPSDATAPDNKPAAENNSVDAPAPSPETIYSKNPVLPVDLLRTFSTNLQLKVGELIIKKQPLTTIALHATTAEDQAKAQLSAQGFDGSINAQTTITNLAATPTIKLSSKLQGVDLTQAQKLALDKPIIEGKGNLQTSLNARGVSVYDWVHTLGGPLDITLNQGKIVGMNISKTACEAVAKVQGKNLELEQPDTHTELQRMKLSMEFDGQGRGEITALDVTIPDLGVNAIGSIDLPRIAFNVPLTIGITGNNLDKSCQLPKAIKLELLCSGQLFKDNPLSFCKPNLPSLQQRFDDLLKAEKEKIAQQLEAEKLKAQQALEAEKSKIQEQAAAEQRKARAAIEEEKRKAQAAVEAQKRQAQEALEAEKRKAEEKAKNKLQDELKKLF